MFMNQNFIQNVEHVIIHKYNFTKKFNIKFIVELSSLKYLNYNFQLIANVYL